MDVLVVMRGTKPRKRKKRNTGSNWTLGEERSRKGSRVKEKDVEG